MLVRKISVALVVVSLALSICACTPSIITPDAGVYSMGKLHAVAKQDTSAVYDATLKAMEQLELDVIEAAKDVFYAKVVAKAADGKTVTVRVKPKEGGGTGLNIRVGTTGNKHRSTVIYERIRQNLGLSGT
jgi:hypothetical protein